MKAGKDLISRWKCRGTESAFFIFAFAFLLLAGSCKDCKKKDCDNGSCLNDVCVCNYGFEGPGCMTTWRQKFIGNYSSDIHICDSGIKPDYNTAVQTVDGEDMEVEFTNLADLGGIVTGTVDSENHLMIDAQSVGNITLWGSGDMSVSRDSLWVNLGISDSTGTDSCAVILLRN